MKEPEDLRLKSVEFFKITRSYFFWTIKGEYLYNKYYNGDWSLTIKHLFYYGYEKIKGVNFMNIIKK